MDFLGAASGISTCITTLNVAVNNWSCSVCKCAIFVFHSDWRILFLVSCKQLQTPLEKLLKLILHDQLQTCSRGMFRVELYWLFIYIDKFIDKCLLWWKHAVTVVKLRDVCLYVFCGIWIVKTSVFCVIPSK